MQANYYYYYCYGHDFKTKLTDIKHRRYSHVLLHIKFQAEMYNAVFTKRFSLHGGYPKRPSLCLCQNISIFRAFLFAADISTYDASRQDSQCLNTNVQPLPSLFISSATSLYQFFWLMRVCLSGLTYCHYSTTVNVALF